jgi:hypothetical protein
MVLGRQGDGSAMYTNAKRRVITGMLDKLKADMLAAIEKMPDDWDETELN